MRLNIFLYRESEIIIKLGFHIVEKVVRRRKEDTPLVAIDSKTSIATNGVSSFLRRTINSPLMETNH